MKLSVIVPAYNEEKSVLEILTRVSKIKIPDVDFEIIVIDDCSTDNTVSLLKSNSTLYHRLLLSEENGGKGAAVLRGLSVATGDYVLFQDADLEYNPEDYSSLVECLRNTNAKIVIGSRFMDMSKARSYYFWNRIGNLAITTAFNFLFKQECTDIYSCYLLFEKKLLDANKLTTRGFEQQAELLVHLVSKGEKVAEVPISYNGRTFEDGKKIRARDGLKVLWVLFKLRFLKLVSK